MKSTKKPKKKKKKITNKYLVEIAKYYGFDGWLVNIEAKLDGENEAECMRDFLKFLTDEMHKQVNGSLVIWYSEDHIQK